jgi:hypothetical protein
VDVDVDVDVMGNAIIQLMMGYRSLVTARLWRFSLHKEETRKLPTPTQPTTRT